MLALFAARTAAAALPAAAVDPASEAFFASADGLFVGELGSLPGPLMSKSTSIMPSVLSRPVVLRAGFSSGRAGRDISKVLTRDAPSGPDRGAGRNDAQSDQCQAHWTRGQMEGSTLVEFVRASSAHAPEWTRRMGGRANSTFLRVPVSVSRIGLSEAALDSACCCNISMINNDQIARSSTLGSETCLNISYRRFSSQIIFAVKLEASRCGLQLLPLDVGSSLR